jgi:hypothetical protein
VGWGSDCGFGSFAVPALRLFQGVAEVVPEANSARCGTRLGLWAPQEPEVVDSAFMNAVVGTLDMNCKNNLAIRWTTGFRR